MEKKLHFTFIFILLFFFKSVFAGATPILPQTQAIGQNDCDAPPPDSFHVSSRGPNFLEITWNPAWNGALHTIIVSINSNSGGGTAWVPLDTFYDIPGSSYTINNIPFEAYCRLGIATNCSYGIPGIEKAYLTDKIILELDAVGRIPINPISTNCWNMNIREHKWVGFGISQNQGDNTNILDLFEFGVEKGSDGKTVRIKRVDSKGLVVAVNNQSNWPTTLDPVLKAPNPFNMKKIQSNGLLQNIGYINLTLYFPAPVIGLCVAQSPPWNNSFIFTPLVAEAVAEEEIRPSGVIKFGNMDKLNNHPRAITKVQNPFNEILTIFLPELYELEEAVSIRLINLNGQTVLAQQFLCSSNEISLPAAMLSNGIYILYVQTGKESQSFKVIKSEYKF